MQYERATLTNMVTSLNVKYMSETDKHSIWHLPTVVMILSTKYIYIKLNSYQKRSGCSFFA